MWVVRQLHADSAIDWNRRPLAGLAARRGGRAGLAILALICTFLAVLGFAGVIAEASPGGLIQRMLEGAVALFILSFGWTLSQNRPVGAKGQAF